MRTWWWARSRSTCRPLTSAGSSITWAQTAAYWPTPRGRATRGREGWRRIFSGPWSRCSLGRRIGGKLSGSGVERLLNGVVRERQGAARALEVRLVLTVGDLEVVDGIAVTGVLVHTVVQVAP